MDRETVVMWRREMGRVGMGMGRMDGKMMGKRDMGRIKMGRREMGSRGMERIEREMMGMGSMRMEIKSMKLLLLEPWYHSTSEQVKEREGTI